MTFALSDMTTLMNFSQEALLVLVRKLLDLRLGLSLRQREPALAPETLAALARYDWPGNVRELQNVIAWMAVHSPRRGRASPSAVPAHVAGATLPAASSFEAAREEFERRFVRAALASANGQRGRAAEALGVTRQGLAKMFRRLHIEAP